MPCLVFGQSLGDLAQKERVRRQDLENTRSKPPVFTDDSLKSGNALANGQQAGPSPLAGKKKHAIKGICPGLFPPFPNALVEPTFDTLIDLKVEAIRLGFSWNWIELPKKGQFDWAGCDDLVSRSHDARIQILALVYESARWANGNQPGNYPPLNDQDFSDFLKVLVARYKPGGEYASSQGWKDGYGIRQWEIWNEPNIHFGWEPRPDAAQYTTMLKGAYDAIKSVDPFAKVGIGGLSLSEGPNNPFDFLQRMYDNGARGKFDAANIHPYVFTNMKPSHMSENILPLREVMNSNGDQDVPIWVTEFGYRSPDGVGPYTQADFVLQTYNDVLPIAEAESNVEIIYWFTLRDRVLHDDTYGLVTDDYRKKPSYAAFRDGIQ